jgi:hypothetical protein
LILASFLAARLSRADGQLRMRFSRSLFSTELGSVNCSAAHYFPAKKGTSIRFAESTGSWLHFVSGFAVFRLRSILVLCAPFLCTLLCFALTVCASPDFNQIERVLLLTCPPECASSLGAEDRSSLLLRFSLLVSCSSCVIFCGFWCGSLQELVPVMFLSCRIKKLKVFYF